jgi:DNA-binding MarR family transcriptional regulator
MTPSLQDVGLAVKRLQWTHHRTANRALARLGLSLVQWDVLRHLHEQPDASLHDLAVLTFQTDQAMGTLAARMVDRGLLDRVNGPGRAVRHQVTDAGEAAWRTGAGMMDDVLAGTIGRLSAPELAVLHGLLLRAAAPETDPAGPETDPPGPETDPPGTETDPRPVAADAGG